MSEKDASGSDDEPVDEDTASSQSEAGASGDDSDASGSDTDGSSTAANNSVVIGGDGDDESTTTRKTDGSTDDASDRRRRPSRRRPSKRRRQRSDSPEVENEDDGDDTEQSSEEGGRSTYDDSDGDTGEQSASESGASSTTAADSGGSDSRHRSSSRSPSSDRTPDQASTDGGDTAVEQVGDTPGTIGDDETEPTGGGWVSWFTDRSFELPIPTDQTQESEDEDSTDETADSVSFDTAKTDSSASTRSRERAETSSDSETHSPSIDGGGSSTDTVTESLGSHVEQTSRPSIGESATESTVEQVVTETDESVDLSALNPDELTITLRKLHQRVLLLWSIQSVINAALVGLIASVVTSVFFEFRPLIAGGLAVGLLLVGLCYSLLKYRVWRYEVREDELYLERGVFTRVRTVVPFVRIQHVDTSREPLERVTGLASLVVYTAGSRGADVTIPGLPPLVAGDLQRRLKRLAIAAEGEDAV